MRQNPIRIASGQGFWGDLPIAPIRQVRDGAIDYLMMDYLAEVTMSILQKQKSRNPDHGYALDFVSVITELLPDIAAGKVKVMSNAGGVNPRACVAAIQAAATRLGITGLNIAVVDGDDILSRLDELLHDGHPLKHMETGEMARDKKESFLSANVYYGAKPMVEALAQGAQIVVTGRVTDTGLALAPLIHEFGWSFDDWDKIAAGTVAGHILECGAQSSGGNLTDWWRVPSFRKIGFPIAEVSPNGDMIITKHPDSDGWVHSMSVKEQLLYEIGDPESYITPDVVADFTSIHVEDEGPDRVRVFGIKGKPATEFYKVSASFSDGYKLTAALTYAWPDAVEKARLGALILQQRAQDLGLNIGIFHHDLIGYQACHEGTGGTGSQQPDEVQLRFSASGASKADLDRLGMEIAPLILTGPGSVTGFAGGRPKATDIVAYWPALISKSAVEPSVTLFQL
ncbi:MAG: hypothetical protein RL177_431 [Bacteroidota bacterium]